MVSIDGFHSTFSLEHYVTMLPADWLIFTSHDTFASTTFYGERCYGIRLYCQVNDNFSFT